MATDQGRASRTTTPRVQIAYESEEDGRHRRRELPFVLGVVGNFSGQPEQPFPKLRERKFRVIDRTSFDAALEAMRPRVALRVDNKLTEDDAQLAVELRFRTLDDFGPEPVARQVPLLREIMTLRSELTDLLRLIRERRADSR